MTNMMIALLLSDCGFCSVLKTKENDVSSVSVMMIETQELAVITGAWLARVTEVKPE